MKATILLAQTPVFDSITRNMENILAGLEYAQEGDILVYPEGAISGCAGDLTLLNKIQADQLGESIEELRCQAQTRQIQLWIGSYIQEGGQWFNAAFGFTPNGGAHQYRKVNLATHEQKILSPGSDLAVFELEVGGNSLRVGVQICSEIRFPEQWGWLARQGCEVFLHLNNAGNEPQLKSVWRSHLVSYAAANQRYVISVNSASNKQTCPTMAVSPNGSVVAEILSDKSEFRRVEIDLEQVSDHTIQQSRQDLVMYSVPEKKERRRILRAMRLNKLQNDLEDTRNNPDLYKEENLTARTEAFEFIRMIDDMYALRPRDQHLEDLYRQGMALRNRLEKINHKVFAKLRGRMKLGITHPDQLREIFKRYTDYQVEHPGKPHYGYEDLDGLISGVFFTSPLPEESLEREPGMIRYQSTPASVILEMIDQSKFSKEDIFYDLGSGLGLVVNLVHILTGVRCVGVEYQPSYSRYAEQIAMDFGLDEVAFINADVRTVDISDGTVFYLFNPFGGHIFDAVMQNLFILAGKQEITICSYGTCTEEIAMLPWLEIDDPDTKHDFKLAIFRSKRALG